MLTPGQRDYLLSRGYDKQSLARDGVFGVTEDSVVDGRPIRDCAGHLGWVARSMSGRAIGIQTRELTEKKYRWHQIDGTEHLPPVFATEEDWDKLWNTGTIILTEGIFDRVALKLALPELATMARLSKGTPPSLRRFLRRYGRSVWTAFDLDEPGEEATQKTEAALGEYLTVTKLTFPFKDPSEMLQRRGLNRLRDCLQRQVEALC